MSVFLSLLFSVTVTAEYVDNLGQVSDSGSSLSSFGSISTDASSSSALTVSDEESGTDSDSDSE